MGAPGKQWNVSVVTTVIPGTKLHLLWTCTEPRFAVNIISFPSGHAPVLASCAPKLQAPKRIKIIHE